MTQWRPPDNEVPARVPTVTGLVNRSPDVVIWLADTLVYSTGVEFAFEIRKRVAAGGINVAGFDFPVTEERGSPLFLGFEWSDTTTSTNLPHAHNNAGGLSQLRAGGTPTSARATFALDHHPPPGPFKVVTAWPHLKLSEHITTFDADHITAAVTSVELLWEKEGVEPSPRENRRPKRVAVIPPEGWFAQHYDPTPPIPPKSL